jgi:DNA-binding NarL/FixJ family response regulator
MDMPNTVQGEEPVVRIFLVDDNAMIRSQLRALLERHNKWVVVGEAADGRTAIKKWGENPPNITLMDFVMPEMNGLETAKELSKQHPDAPILMVTVDPSNELMSEAKKAGIRGLCKKSDLKSVLAAIEALLSGRTYFPRTAAA